MHKKIPSFGMIGIVEKPTNTKRGLFVLKNSISKNAEKMQEKKSWENLEVHEEKQALPLVDRNLKGKERPWNEKAKSKEKIANLFDLLGMHYQADNILHCGSWLKFLQCSDKPHEHPKSLVYAPFCKNKFCEMCNWRRSRRYTHQLDQLLTEVNKRREGLAWVFLTLTVRNVHCTDNGYDSDRNELKETIDGMMKSWQMFEKDRQFKKRVVGWVRALEVTINNDVSDKQWYGSYHPHFHILLAVDKKEYFGKNSKLYLEQGDWVELWKRCAKLDYDPVVHVEKIKQIKSFQEMAEVATDKLDKIKSPVLEVAKYPLKSVDIFHDAKYQRLKNGKKVPVKQWEIDEIDAKKRLWHLFVGLNKKRLLGFGGLIKKIRQELNQKDLEAKNADLVHTDDGHEIDVCNCPSCGAIRKIWHYSWTKDGYITGGKQEG